MTNSQLNARTCLCMNCRALSSTFNNISWEFTGKRNEHFTSNIILWSYRSDVTVAVWLKIDSILRKKIDSTWKINSAWRLIGQQRSSYARYNWYGVKQFDDLQSITSGRTAYGRHRWQSVFRSGGAGKLLSHILVTLLWTIPTLGLCVYGSSGVMLQSATPAN